MFNNKFIIAFEGIDGAGKTTQSLKLCDYLHNKGLPCRYVRVAEQLEIDKKIIANIEKYYENTAICFEKWLKASLLTYERSKILHQHVTKNDNHEILIFDRYKYITKLYMQYEKIGSHIPDLLAWLPNPDIIFFLDIDVNTALTRINLRKKEIYEFEDEKCLNYLVENFMNTIGDTGNNLHIIYAQDEIEAIHERIVNKFDEIYCIIKNNNKTIHCLNKETYCN